MNLMHITQLREHHVLVPTKENKLQILNTNYNYIINVLFKTGSFLHWKYISILTSSFCLYLMLHLHHCHHLLVHVFYYIATIRALGQSIPTLISQFISNKQITLLYVKSICD